ncbi:hypothetical protein Tco_0233826 [Tanacetum coccineum]
MPTMTNIVMTNEDVDSSKRGVLLRSHIGKYGIAFWFIKSSFLDGETAPPKFMKIFLVQKVDESRKFVNRIRDKAATTRDCVAQLTALFAELQAMEDQEEFHDNLLAAKDAKRGEEGKLQTLNEVIAEAAGIE